MTEILVVIGAGGMGETIARRSGSGKKVVLADFNEGLLSDLAVRMRVDGFDVATQIVDVSSAEPVRGLAQAASQFGPVTSVVHTAGLSSQSPAAAVLRVNLLGVKHMLESFAEVIAPGGAAVVISSMAGVMAVESFDAATEDLFRHTPANELLALSIVSDVGASGDATAAYRLTKRANQLQVQAASVPWGGRSARVNSVSPGIISTPLGHQELAGPNGHVMRSMIEKSGTGRIGTPTDIAAAVDFLLGNDSTFVTGTDLLVDGGVVAATRSTRTRSA